MCRMTDAHQTKNAFTDDVDDHACAPHDRLTPAHDSPLPWRRVRIFDSGSIARVECYVRCGGLAAEKDLNTVPYIIALHALHQKKGSSPIERCQGTTGTTRCTRQDREGAAVQHNRWRTPRSPSDARRVCAAVGDVVAAAHAGGGVAGGVPERWRADAGAREPDEGATAVPQRVRCEHYLGGRGRQRVLDGRAVQHAGRGAGGEMRRRSGGRRGHWRPRCALSPGHAAARSAARSSRSSSSSRRR
jgi:hypothetical protein